MDNNAYYGAEASADTKTLGERLREYYEPHEFVTIQNIDTLALKYQFASPEDIETFSNYPGHKDTVVKRPPQVVVLQPGETKLCPAYEADLMIENLIKQIAVRKAEQQAKDNKVLFATGNWTDPELQKNLIDQIFVGKEDVVSKYNAQVKEKPSGVESKSKTA